MIYLGIDPGSHRIGYGVIRSEPRGMVPLDYGVIENFGTDRSAHITHVEYSLNKLVTQWSPTAAGIERLFFSTNRKTAMAVSEMRGVILAALNRTPLSIHEFTPPEVKRSVCGYGKADKHQVQKMVQMILGITAPVKPDDAADALAIALCCAVAAEGRMPR